MKELLEEFASSVAYALRLSRLRPRHQDAGQNDRELAQAAETIVKQLVLSNWRFEKGPPAEPHKTP